MQRVLTAKNPTMTGCWRPRAVVDQWLLSGDGFGLLQHGESDLRLTELLILFLKSAVPVLSDGGLSF
jgi:hypothetical protein